MRNKITLISLKLTLVIQLPILTQDIILLLLNSKGKEHSMRKSLVRSFRRILKRHRLNLIRKLGKKDRDLKNPKIHNNKYIYTQNIL